jgi:non-homologous end joining protein Ku
LQAERTIHPTLSSPRPSPKRPPFYGTALKELVQEKINGHTIVAKEVERPAVGNVVDLMEALKRSIEGAAPAKESPRAAGRRDPNNDCETNTTARA